MSSGFTIDPDYDDYSSFMFVSSCNHNAWSDRQVTQKNVPEKPPEIEQQILEIYNSGNQVLPYQTVHSPQNLSLREIQPIPSSKGIPFSYDSAEFLQYIREFHQRLIEEQNQVINEVYPIEGGLPPLEPISETNYPSLWAVQAYCLEHGISLSPPKHHSGGFKEFWKEHKKAIIIAAVVIVVAAAVAIVIVTTAGTGTSVAVATGASAAEAAINEFNSSEDSHPKVPKLELTIQPKDEIQNFAQSIGAIDVKNTNESITIIETNSIPSEVTPEILNELVTHWNSNLAPAIERDELLIEEAVLNDELTKPAWKESIIDLARKTGSAISHEIVDAAGQIVSVVPQALEEIKTIGEQLGFNQIFDTSDLGDAISSTTPQEKFNEGLGFVHEKIDKLFGTNQAPAYDPDASQPFTVGYLPVLVPGAGKIPVTQANNTWGWRLGDPIQNRTTFGTIPKWDTVRARFWKNEAHFRSEGYKPDQLGRMRQGLAPQRISNTGQIETMELHHIPPQREGGLFDFIKVWPDEHANLDPNRRLKR